MGARGLEDLIKSDLALREPSFWMINIIRRIIHPNIIRCISIKPWRRKLGQYSFLESYGQVPLLSRKFFSPFTRLVKLPRVGQDGDFNVPLSDLVKQAMVTSLLRHVQDEAVPLSRGTATITSYQLLGDIPNACELENTDAQVILVWHIATSIFESLPDHRPYNEQDFLVATQLSKYCAYLLTFAPELLPSHPYITERLFDTAVQQAQGFNIQGSNVCERYQDWVDVELGPAANNGNIVVRGTCFVGSSINRSSDERRPYPRMEISG